MDRVELCLSGEGQDDALAFTSRAHPTGAPFYRNRTRAEVVSIQQGLGWVTVRLSVGDEVPVCVRWRNQMNVEPRVRIGEQLDVSIRSEAVLLGASDIWPGLPQWNRWRGRIVLVRPQEETFAITVKLFGASWTLVGTNRVEGCIGFPQSWDEVNLVVDPTAIRLRGISEGSDSGKWVTAAAIHAMSPPRVYMKGRLRRIQCMHSGYLVAIQVASAMVSAVVEADCNSVGEWFPGMSLEVSVNGADAWIKPSDRDLPPIQCVLVYQEMTESERERVLTKK